MKTPVDLPATTLAGSDGFEVAEAKPIRTRTVVLAITIGFAGLALVVAVLVLRQVLAADTAGVTDRSLRTQSQELVRLLADNDGETGVLIDSRAERVLSDYYESEVTAGNKSLVVVDGGRIRALVGLPLDDFVPTVQELAVRAQADGVVLVDGQAGNTELRVVARRLVDQAGIDDGALIVALAVGDRQAFIDRAFRDGVLVAIGTLLLIVPLAWLVSGWLIRPVELLAGTAQEITEHQLSQRLPKQGTAEMSNLIESFNAMVDRLEHAVQEQRRFFNDASHELRTPLTIMRGHLEVAKDNPDRAENAFIVALTELDRMGRIVDDLLVLARAAQVGFLRIAPVDSDDFISSILSRVSEMSDHRWVLDALPIGVIRADSQRLDQIMLNLCVNASRHTPPGQEIGIGAELNKGQFAMWVRDTGEGIDPADHKMIFERFQRAGLDRRSGGGPGLGLSIVRAIAEAHGGTVSVHSERGRGATFTVVIPTEGGLPEAAPPQSTAVEPSPSPRPGPGTSSGSEVQ